MTFKTPTGNPASCINAANSNVVEGSFSDGFKIKVLPHTIAGTNIHVETILTNRRAYTAGILNQIVTTQQHNPDPADSRRLARLCGQFDENLRQIEERLDVQIKNRGNAFQLTGHPDQVATASTVLDSLYRDTFSNREITPDQVHLQLSECLMDAGP